MAYIDWAASLSFNEIKNLLKKHGANMVLVKQLSANQDNSKNQIYAGGDISQLNMLPMGEPVTKPTTSRKTASKKTIQVTLSMPLVWLTPEGIQDAPSAKFIFYPQYPEVRISGFLRGVSCSPRGILGSRKTSVEGRLLLLSGTEDGRILGLALPAGAAATEEILNNCGRDFAGAFKKLLFEAPPEETSLDRLKLRLKGIVEKGWIPSCRIEGGVRKPYSAKNGAGYTLEAMLGISPNGYAQPDFEDFEIKTKNVKTKSSPVTLLTPEPTGGIYHDDFLAFMEEFGHLAKDREDKLYFTGQYKVGGLPVEGRPLRLVLDGWDGQELAADAELSLRDKQGRVAASWGVSKLVEHWSRKHSKACYITYEKRMGKGGTFEYRYLPGVQIFEGATLKRLLDGFLNQQVYLDPGTSMDIKTHSRKKRNQFRAKSSDLVNLYENGVFVDLG